MSAAVKAIKESNSKQEKLQEELKAIESEIKKLQTEYGLAKSNLESAGIKLNERSAGIKTLKRIISELEKQKSVIQNDVEIITSLKVKIKEEEGIIQKLRTELSDARDSNKQLLFLV